MSKLIDKFHRIKQSSTQPIGFRTARQVESEPGLLVIISAAPDDIGKLGDEVSIASAVLFRPGDPKKFGENARKTLETLPDMPLGVYLDDGDSEELSAKDLAKCDFLVLPVSSRVSNLPDDEKMGKIIEIDSSMDDSLLRAVNSLPIDAVIASDTFESGSLAWHQLMIFQHLANLFSRPLIINAPASIAGEELKRVWEAGVDGLLVDTATIKASELKKLREAIKKLPPRSSRKKGKIEATLPRMGGEGGFAAPDEDDDDE